MRALLPIQERGHRPDQYLQNAKSKFEYFHQRNGIFPFPTTTLPLGLTAARLSEVDPYQLHHVRLQQVDVPPGGSFHVRQRAGRRVEEGRSGAVHGLLRDAVLHHGGLHRGLAGGHVQNWKR